MVYAVQNNIYYVALANIDATTYSVSRSSPISIELGNSSEQITTS